MRAGLDAGYRMYSVSAWYDLATTSRSGVMVRHDVDRRPDNALAMARLEADFGVASTYYFRVLPCAFEPRIIDSICKLGHEIGYHYEDLHLAKGDPKKAICFFSRHLDKLRQIAPVRSIAMHGSPLARQNNMAIWDHEDFANYGVIDAILSFDYSDYTFFTDSGRTFGTSNANLRDYLGAARTEHSVRSSDDLANWLSGASASKIQINVHPERWNQPGLSWLRQWSVDIAANTIKRGLRTIRSVQPL